MVRGVIWNLAGMIVTALTMLVTIPLFLRYFGAERYGILATIWVLFGYFSILDFGMGPAIVSFLSRPDRSDGQGASGVFWTAFLMNIVVGGVLALVVMAGVRLADNAGLFVQGAIRDELIAALPLLLVMLPVSLIYPILVGALDARRLFGLANANQVIGTILSQALPLVAIAVFKPTLTVAIAGTVGGRALSAVAILFFCVRHLELTAPRFERALARQLMSFGGWVALSSGASSVLETADRLVVTSLLGGAAAAWYTIAYNVVTRARVLPQAIARALYPQVAADSAGGTRALVSSARVMVLVLVPALTLGMVLLDPLCALWLGDRAAAGVVPIARIMLLGVYANCLAYIPFVALQARGDPHRLAKVHLWETPVFLIVMYGATVQFGIIGTAVSWSVRLLLDTTILLWITGLRRVLYADVLLPLLVPAGAFAIALFVPGEWIVQTGIAVALLMVWAVVDTVVAERAEVPVSLRTLARQLHMRLGAHRLAPTP